MSATKPRADLIVDLQVALETGQCRGREKLTTVQINLMDVVFRTIAIFVRNAFELPVIIVARLALTRNNIYPKQTRFEGFFLRV
jgi:hypothetical protein